MRRIPLLHLWLCALLSFQQPSVLVQMGTWLRGCVQVDAEDTTPPAWSEEEKLPGLRSGSRHRLKAEAARQRKWDPPHAPVLESRQVPPTLAPVEAWRAARHWRAALLPPRVPPDDEQRGRG